MAYRRPRRARSSRRPRVLRRRSSRRFTKKSFSRSRTTRRFGRSKKAPRITVKRFTDLYPDVFMTKMKDNVMIPYNAARTAIDYNTILENVTTARNCVVVVLNANPNGGAFVIDPISPGLETFDPNPSDMLEQRYLVYRPMGAKVTIAVQVKQTTDETNSGTSPQAYIAGFPYVTEGNGSANPSIPQGNSMYSNYWDQTASLGLTPDNIPQLKYGWKRMLQGKGGKSSVTFSKYYSFAKLLGMTNEQYMAEASTVGSNASTANQVLCSTGNSLNPSISFRLAFCVADFISDDASTEYVYQIRVTQYGRWETVKLLTS